MLTSGATIQNLLNAGVTINDLLAAGATTDQFIGANYQGGKIAYFLQSGDTGYDPAVSHGIIAAPYDQATCYWGPDDYNPAGTSTNIGSGAANTGIIVNTFRWSGGFAAKICNDLVLNNYSDWYLPSRDELNQLYLNKTAIGGFTELTGKDAYYWSSSASSLGEWDLAWSQSFSGGYQSSNRIVYTWIHVRAVRSF